MGITSQRSPGTQLLQAMRLAGLAGAIVGLASTACVAQQFATFTRVGDLPGGAFLSESWAISGDGQIAWGGSVEGGGGFSPRFAACGFGEELGLFSIFSDASGPSIVAFGASFDGGVVTGKADHGSFSPLGVQAWIYRPGIGAVEIGDLPGGATGVARGIGRAVSSDGAFAAGIGESVRGTEAWRYEIASETFVPLGDLAGGPFASYAMGISGDGAVVVGSSSSSVVQSQQAFRWTVATGIRPLGFLPAPAGTTPNSLAEAVSADGLVIVGQSSSAASSPNGNEAFRWTAATGMQALGDLPGGGFQSWAYACNADGSVIVGRASVQGPCGPFGCGSLGRAFIWDATNGMRNVQQMLVDAGIDMTGWSLLEARGISADGTVITGNGINPMGSVEAWLVRLSPPPPPVCAADFDGDGQLTPDDLADYIGVFFGVPPGVEADFNGDGGVDPDDLADFISGYFGGC